MTRMRGIALGILLSAGGCSFDSAEPGPVVVNSCSMAMECVSGADCVNGMCIAQKADARLTIALEVTPVRQPDGSSSVPILLEAFTVDMPMERTFELAATKRFQGFVLQQSATGAGAVPIEADITFTPVETIRGIESKVITVAATPTRGSVDPDFSVSLLERRQYRMVVRPRVPSLPPHYAMVFGGDPDAVIEYPPTTQLFARDVVVKGAAAGRTLRVRALAVGTAEPISSTATLEDGEGTLHFWEAPDAFTLEIRSETTYPATRPPGGLANDVLCDGDTPSNPVFTAKSEDLSKDGALRVELPELPAHIMFEGWVNLCDAGLDAAAPDSLAISLHADDLLPDDAVLAAAFEASTTATYNAENRSLDFCVQVIPGQHYEVLATPPSTMPCALLNKEHTVAAPPGEMSPGSVSFDLPDAAYLSGTLRTMDSTPLRGAAIDAIALASGADRYNRSRPASTDVDGSFKLQIDLGTYDVIIKPAPGSGLPWQVRHNVVIGKADDFATAIDMHLPVAVEGSLVYRGASTADPSLKDAVVAAYAIIVDGGSDRAVPIGSTTADQNGRFTLLLPPSIQSGWLSPTR